MNERPGVKPTPSYIPTVAAGDQDSATFDLPDGRYLVTVKSPDHKLWGKHFSLPADAGEILVELRPHPLPLGKLVVYAFEDNQPVNSAPDEPETTAPGPEGLEGFEVRLHDTVAEMQADYNGDPLCGGVCLTGPDGSVEIPNLAPGRYEIEVLPPDGTDWLQTSTFEGTHLIDFARVTENDDGRGAIGEGVTAANTAYWFGFIHVPVALPPCAPGACAKVTGRAMTWQGWPPYNELVYGEPVPEPLIALSNVGQGDLQVYADRGNLDGTFEIDNVPPGSYQMAIFDENLDWLMRWVTFEVAAGETLDLNSPDIRGVPGVAVARWFGWISGHVFRDANEDGIKDPGEPGLAGIDLDLRFRDGSVKKATFTDSQGFYEYPEELALLSKFVIAEVGFGRFARTGMSVHDEHNPALVSPLPTGLGGGLLLNQLTVEGHRTIVDWGKRPYEAGEHGGITGIVYYATTRNEFDPRLAGAEDYEPGIPDATVKLWGPGPDHRPNTPDDVLVNEVATDAWSHPRIDHPDEPQSCEVRNALGAAFPPFIPDIGAFCIEFPTLSNQTKDGAFDGGYAIETMLNHPITGAPTPSEPLLPPGDYVVEVVPPPYYQVIKEEDQNTDEGGEFVPQIPPPPCVGPLHLVNDPRNPADGQQKPLCNKRLVTLEDGQNPAADFFLFTDVDADPTTNTAAQGSWNTVDSVAPPGRIFGLVADDIRFDRDPTSPWFGQPRALPNTPVGVYDYDGRRIAMLHTDEHGLYDVVLPSTQTYDCPTPAGVCPGTYVLRVNDPADPAYRPDFLTEPLAFDVWPGKTTYADTPVDPISGVSCTLGAALEGQGQQPEFFRVGPNPYIQRSTTAANQAQRELTIDGAGFGDSRGTLGQVTLGGAPLPASAYLFWNDRQIRIRVPNNLTPVGPQQLLIRGASGVWVTLGITIHVRGSGYHPTDATIRNVVPGPGTPIQDAVDAASNGDLIIVRPGNYNENVIMHRRVKLQGVGPGGTIGALEFASPDDLRFTIVGSVVNGRNFFDREDAWNAKLDTIPFVGNQTVPGGAGITVVARTTSQFTNGNGRAMIDGLGIILGQGGGVGGIQVNAFARFLEITNNIMENNGGEIGGAIGLGLPYFFPEKTGPDDAQNDDIRIAYNRLLGNGGRATAGSIGIFDGAERYLVEKNQICANFSGSYGGGISHFGFSGGQVASGAAGRIRDNHFYANESFDSGGAIMIRGQRPADLGGVGSGRVDIERNYIWHNLSNDDGGGLFLIDTLTSRVRVESNIIANNVATDVGGGVLLDDAANVVFVNNTVVRNNSTDTAEDQDGEPNGAGLVSEPNDSGGGFSHPVAFYNNIFWNNEAFTYDPTLPGDPGAPPGGLVSAGMIDLEVYGVPGQFSPRNSILTNGLNTVPHPSNLVGADPLFINEHPNEIDVGPNRFAPNELFTEVLRGDPPPPFKEGQPGDYHLSAATSPAINAGASSIGGFGAPTRDIDFDVRPLPAGGAWDIGADEWTGVAPPPNPNAPNFTVAASPGTRTIDRGASTTYGVTVTRQNGWAQDVALSVSGLPASSNGTFNPSTVLGGNGPSTLTVQTQASTPTGTYQLTITGTGGSLVRTTQVTLVVQDFSIGATPSSRTVAPGEGTTYDVAITRLEGFSGSVDLAATGLPSGAGATFSPDPAGGTSSTMTVTTSVVTPTGSYPLTITGESGSLSHSAQVTLVVSSSPPTSAYATEVLNDSPRAYWRLGEASGTTAADETTPAEPGTYQNGVVLGAAGAIFGDANTAARFDGTNDQVSMGDPTSGALDFGTGDFSVEAWVKTSVNGERIIASKRGASANYWQISVTDDSGHVGEVRVNVNSSQVYGPAGKRVDNGAWHHVVVAFDRDTAITVYVDGVARVNPGAHGGNVNNTGPFLIGFASSYYYINGDVDEVAVYPTLLSAARVQAHYDAGTAP